MLAKLSLCLFKQGNYGDALPPLLKARDILTNVAPMSKLMIDGEYMPNRRYIKCQHMRIFCVLNLHQDH